MGIGRMIWRSNFIGRSIDTIKNIVDEGGVVDGVKRTLKEDYCEDNPITSIIYQCGRDDGKVDGYEEASNEYEEKLLKQADEFLKQEHIFESQKDDYEKLLDEYEKEIEGLSEKINLTESENEYLQKLLLRERRLKKISG